MLLAAHPGGFCACGVHLRFCACGALIPLQAGRGRPRLTCSDECPRTLQRRSTGFCTTCSKPLVGQRRLVCSTECQKARTQSLKPKPTWHFCRKCGGQLPSGGLRRFCSECKPPKPLRMMQPPGQRFCEVCKAEILGARLIRRAITCSPECGEYWQKHKYQLSQNHRQRQLERSARWQKTHPDYVRKRNEQYMLGHIDAIREKREQRNQFLRDHPEERAAIRAKARQRWRDAHPPYQRATNCIICNADIPAARPRNAITCSPACSRRRDTAMDRRFKEAKRALDLPRRLEELRRRKIRAFVWDGDGARQCAREMARQRLHIMLIAERRWLQPRVLIARSCAVCGKLHDVRGGRGRPRLTCSPECAVKHGHSYRQRQRHYRKVYHRQRLWTDTEYRHVHRLRKRAQKNRQKVRIRATYQVLLDLGIMDDSDWPANWQRGQKERAAYTMALDLAKTDELIAAIIQHDSQQGMTA